MSPVCMQVVIAALGLRAQQTCHAQKTVSLQPALLWLLQPSALSLSCPGAFGGEDMIQMLRLWVNTLYLGRFNYPPFTTQIDFPAGV